MTAALLFLLIPLVAGIGVAVTKWLDQKGIDANRRTYKLAFPSDLDGERVDAWLKSISGTLISGSRRLFGVPTIAFEVWATQQGIQHRMKVPYTHADYVVSQLRSLVPGIRVEPEDQWPARTKWTRSVEVGLTRSSHQLRIYNSADVAASILSALQALKDNEVVMIQWVVSPTTPERLPVQNETKSDEVSLHQLVRGGMANRDEIEDRRAKLKDPNVLAVLRVAAIANTPVRGDHLIYRVKAALSSVRSPSTRFVKRQVSSSTLTKRIANCSAPLFFPMQLSTPEMTALLAWPIGNPFISGLPAPMSRQLPAPLSVPSVGRVLGRSTFPGSERPVALGYKESLQHLWLLGATGSGKSVTLTNVIKQDMEHGYGVVVMEPQGSLIENIVDVVPPDRVDDVIVMDVNDMANPVGFNLMQQASPHVVADELSALFEHMYENSGVWAKELFFFGLRTLAEDPQATFIDLSALVMPQNDGQAEWRRNLINKVQDPEIRQFWRRLDSQAPASRMRIAQPVLDRIWQLTARRELRNIIGQSESTFTMDDVVRNNKILLVNLSKLPKESSSLMGTLIMNSLWHSVQAVRADKPTFLHIDEFQRFLNLPIEPDDMLARARGLGLGMTLAHQHLDQLPKNVEQAVLNNAKSKMVFQASSDDARTVAREFGDTVTANDFMHMARYETMVRVMTQTGMSPPMTVANTPPAQSNGRGKAVLKASREKYGRPVAEVEQAMRDRYSTSPPAYQGEGQRPTIGGDGWD